MAVNDGAFDPLDVWFAEKPRASSDQWQVDGSVIRRPKPSTFYAASSPGGLSRKNDRRDRIVVMCLLVVGVGLLLSRLL